jgi:hypothetical protein
MKPKQPCGSVPGNTLVVILRAGLQISGKTKSTPANRFSSETYAVECVSSLRNGMLKNCVFGTYGAVATKLLSFE